MILGRPFLATGQALIDVKDGELTLRMGDDQVKFNLYLNLKIYGDDKVTCFQIDSLIPSRDKLIHEFMDKDPLEEYLVHSLSVKELNNEKVPSNPALAETVLNLEENEDAMVVAEELQTPDGLVLKELPPHLRYAFLGENNTKLVIISVEINDEIEKELLLVLKRNMRAFAWSIDDIKGISSSIFMHKIMVEEEANPTVEYQQSLNPTMKDVVKKEVLKWLNVGSIYVILTAPG